MECEAEHSLPHNVATCNVRGFTSTFSVSSSSTVTGHSCNFPLPVRCNAIWKGEICLISLENRSNNMDLPGCCNTE
jgi:hypothetical protein